MFEKDTHQATYIQYSTESFGPEHLPKFQNTVEIGVKNKQVLFLNHLSIFFCAFGIVFLLATVQWNFIRSWTFLGKNDCYRGLWVLDFRLHCFCRHATASSLQFPRILSFAIDPMLKMKGTFCSQSETANPRMIAEWDTFTSRNITSPSPPNLS